MELLPIITKALFVLGAIFIIVLIVSFLISRFRKDKNVITETYPAQRYQYFSNSVSNEHHQNIYDENIDEESLDSYLNQIDEIQLNGNNYENDYKNHWVDFEDEEVIENPLRKTATFNFMYDSNTNEVRNERMTILNEEPLFKHSWN